MGQAGEFMLLTKEQAAAFPFLPLLKCLLLNGLTKQHVFGAAELHSGDSQVHEIWGENYNLWLLAFDLCYPSSLVNIFFYNCK